MKMFHQVITHNNLFDLTQLVSHHNRTSALKSGAKNSFHPAKFSCCLAYHWWVWFYRLQQWLTFFCVSARRLCYGILEQVCLILDFFRRVILLEENSLKSLWRALRSVYTAHVVNNPSKRSVMHQSNMLLSVVVDEHHRCSNSDNILARTFLRFGLFRDNVQPIPTSLYYFSTLSYHDITTPICSIDQATNFREHHDIQPRW